LALRASTREYGLMTRSHVLCFLALLSVPAASFAQACAGNPVAVQILGSGGPRLNAERASASYLLWVNGQAKFLVDAGGGTFLRFGQSQAKLSDLAMFAISHLHPDHTSDLPALLWLSQTLRKEPLPISGPSGNDLTPDFPVFLSRLFDEKNGAFPLLSATLGKPRSDGAGGVPLDVRTIDVTKAEPTAVFEGQGLKVTAIGIPHGRVPALAYRVETNGVSVVFSTDQTGTDPKFIGFAKGANALIMHFTIGAGATSPLHAAPAVVGRVAHDAGAGRLILGHIGQFDMDAAVAELGKFYTGPLTVGADLQCTQVQ